MPRNKGNMASGRGKPKPLRRAGTSRAGTPRAGNSEDCPQPHPQGLRFIISGILTNENTVEDQRVRIAAEANQATIRTVQNQQIMANENGKIFFEEFSEIRERLTNLETQHNNLETQHNNLETQHNNLATQFSELQQTLINIRERNYLTFLRDHVNARFSKTYRDRIQTLNSSAVHGGDALLDAAMFLLRRDSFPEERRLFKAIYGLSADKIQVLRSTEHSSILRVLNLVGYAHLSGKVVLEKEELEKTFNDVVELVNDGQIEEAERLASGLSSSYFAYQYDE